MPVVPSDTSSRQPLIQLRGVSKSYGGNNYALKDVDLDIHSGQALAIVGENGAGKSTLMKVLCGAIGKGDFEGSYTLESRATAFSNVHDAQSRGVVLIPQETQVAPGLSVAENMAMGRLPMKYGFVDRQRLHEQAGQWLDLFHLTIDPQSPIDALSASEKKLVLIAEALSRDAKVLILDEPTAALSDTESRLLFEHLEQVWANGTTTVFVTHRLDELATVSRRTVVLRNGLLVADFDDGRTPARSEIVRAMVGREINHGSAVTNRPAADAPAMLEVSSMSLQRATGRVVAQDINLRVRSGEIVGLYGLVGAGRTEVAEALFGYFDGRVDGTVTLDGQPYRPTSPRQAIDRGVGMLTEDRKATGLIFGNSVQTNLTVAALGRVCTLGFIDSTAEAELTEHHLATLDIRPRNPKLYVEALSGGNQQKVLLGRWLAAEPKLLILDEPTLGVDVGARMEIYAALERLVQQGAGVLLITSDTEEVIGQCHRTFVMYKGRIRKEFEGVPDRHSLVSASTGGAV